MPYLNLIFFSFAAACVLGLGWATVEALSEGQLTVPLIVAAVTALVVAAIKDCWKFRHAGEDFEEWRDRTRGRSK